MLDGLSISPEEAGVILPAKDKLLTEDQAASPELNQKIQIDQTLRGILSDPATSADLKAAGFYGQHSIPLAFGRSNEGWEGGWQNTASLYTDGQVMLGAGYRFRDHGEFSLLPMEEVRQGLLKAQQDHFDRVVSDLDYRNFFVGPSWEDPESIGRKHFGNPANRPSMESSFPAIPTKLIDSEGRAFIDPRNGLSLYDHPLYKELLGNTTPDYIREAVRKDLDALKQNSWWQEAYQKTNIPTSNPNN